LRLPSGEGKTVIDSHTAPSEPTRRRGLRDHARGSGHDPSPIPDRSRVAEGWRRFVPWQGPATRGDWALMGAILGSVAVALLVRPLKPFLLDSYPAALAFLTGDLTAIGAAAAFARIGESPLWLVVVAGAAGMVKTDWLLWWAGRPWGGGMIRMFTTSERAQHIAGRAAELNPWILRAAVVLAVVPGVPTPVVYVMAGWARMRLITFLLLDLAGALLLTGLVAGLGYGLGQRAVDFVLLVDKYASTVSLTMIAVTLAIPPLERRIRQTSSRGATAPAPTPRMDVTA
jgi:membrane protein DedA with SNARE-associated domain